ncbi:MAG: haloacid dehalogenase type II [Alphaproteobacteria bacterium]|nr:haloacid dehalogenase type II [Alphaproteobacteria bacterium]MCB9929718.1 haloacid dehalogenase type II [Alphaproteobacteria bacterium]
MRLSDFTTLTFDCYGTLIDWEAGIVAAVRSWLTGKGAEKSDDDILSAFATAESSQQRDTPAMRYPELLGHTLRRMAHAWEIEASDAEAATFGNSVKDWPAFPDAAAALARLKRHYRLVILSNVDHVSFEASKAKLGNVFDAVYTAQDVGSYKPNPRNFAYMLEHEAAAGIPPSKILHTAQSLFHDHVQAKAHGLHSAWIDRRIDADGWGATMPPEAPVTPDFHFPTLEAMADAREAE